MLVKSRALSPIKGSPPATLVKHSITANDAKQKRKEKKKARHSAKLLRVCVHCVCDTHILSCVTLCLCSSALQSQAGWISACFYISKSAKFASVSVWVKFWHVYTRPNELIVLLKETYWRNEGLLFIQKPPVCKDSHQEALSEFYLI